MASIVPPGFLVRPPTMNDLDAVTALTNASEIADSGMPETTIELVRTRWQAPGVDLAADNWLVISPEGHVVMPGKFEEWEYWTIKREKFDPTLWFLAFDGDEIAGISLCHEPPHTCRGLVASLCLNSKGEPCALASMTATSPWERTPKIYGTMTRYQSFPTVAEPLASNERYQSTKNVLPEHGILAQNPSVQLERYRGGELSLSPEGECLSLQAEYSTNVQNVQDAIPPRSKETGLPSPISVSTREVTGGWTHWQCGARGGTWAWVWLYCSIPSVSSTGVVPTRLG